jgi:hypothetical protein
VIASFVGITFISKQNQSFVVLHSRPVVAFSLISQPGFTRSVTEASTFSEPSLEIPHVSEYVLKYLGNRKVRSARALAGQ